MMKLNEKYVVDLLDMFMQEMHTDYMHYMHFSRRILM